MEPSSRGLVSFLVLKSEKPKLKQKCGVVMLFSSIGVEAMIVYLHLVSLLATEVSLLNLLELG